MYTTISIFDYTGKLLTQQKRPYSTTTKFIRSQDGAKDYLQIFLGHDQPDTMEIYTQTAAIDMRGTFQKAY